MSELNLEGVGKSFGDTRVIDHIDLHVEDGEFVVFVGPSGCGKSTLLRIIAGLEEASGGDIVIGGRVVNALPPVERGIAMVFQSYALYPHMSVFENIAFPLRVERLPEDEVRARVAAAAAVLQMDTRLDEKPARLSGGQRQRVAIGRAIVRQPGIFLFDEPLSNLDAALRADMRLELLRLHETLGTTMIYVTHDQVEAMTMADKIVVLNGGVIEQTGAPLDLYHRPANRFVAEFIGSPRMNFLDARCTAAGSGGITLEVDVLGTVTLPREDAGVPVGSTLALGIRPEHVELVPAGHAFEIVPGIVERLGGQTIVHDDRERRDGAGFIAAFDGDPPLRTGEALTVHVDPGRCHLFDTAGQVLARASAAPHAPDVDIARA